MTAPSDEAGIRHWLVDYLVANIGCRPDDIDYDASMHDLGVGSRDAVVLAGELGEWLGRPVSPVEFWQHPSINALARFLIGAEPESPAETAAGRDRDWADEPIAVIGMGCRLPGDINGPESLWDALMQGRSGVGEVPAGRWSAFDDGSPEAAAALAGTTRWGSFLSEVDGFDAEYFEISPREAEKMDPQQRLLLEVTHEALEHAGIPADSLAHTQTGVFAGASVTDYGYLASADLSQVDAWSGTGAALSIIANRVSYYFDLRGPSVTVDTACSSSLVAVHLACQSLRTGDSNVALAAGVNLLLTPAITRSFDQADAMSPSGTCHAFDAAADGFVRGEGCGVVVLKRLADAQRDGDRVLAVVRGSAVNQDGRSNGLMAPNPAAQMAVLRAAYASAGIEPRDVDFVEAHGTGTLLGDPIEARALGTVLGRARPPSAAPLLIGAVKSNLGHLEAAAGIAGFIKTVLAVERAHIPANLHFETPNPHIPFEKLRLKIVAEATDWPVTDHPRRAGVSAFGFGGTNAHAVLEQAPERAPAATVESPPGPPVTTLVVSGKSAERVASSAAALADWMEGDGAAVALADVAHTVNHHRTRHAKFATVCAVDRAHAVAGLRAVAQGGSADGVVSPHQGVCRPGTVFVYSGQGSQWAGMGRRLLADEPVFAAAVAEMEPVFVENVGFSLQQVLAGGERLVGIERIQPVLVAVQLALTQLWRSYGVHPDAVIGHSMGEVSAAVVAEALTVAEGLRVIATRSRLMSRLSGQGAMALLEVEPAAAEELIIGYPGITVAVHAAPRQSVIAGPPEQVDALIAEVAAQDRWARRIEVDVASHHPIIDPVLPDLRIALADLEPQTPAIPLITTTFEHTMSDEIVVDADYWAANLRNPVRFSEAVAAAGEHHGTFVEVSPHPVLTHAITETLAEIHHHSIPTLLRDTYDTLTFHTHLNTTHTVHPPQTEHLPEPHAQLPPTPWRHGRYWTTVTKRAQSAVAAPRSGTLLGGHTALAGVQPVHLWQARLLPEAKPYPGSHRIDGVEVVPISVLLQTLSAAAAHLGNTVLSDLRFEHPIVVDQPRVIQVVANDQSVTISSSRAADTDPPRWTRHATATITRDLPEDRPSESGRGVFDAMAAYDMSSAAELQRSWGIDGQPFVWEIGSCRVGPGELHADVTAGPVGSRGGSAEASGAALVDVAVHVARLVDTSNPRLMVPAAAGSFRIRPDSDLSRGHVEVRRRGGGEDHLVVDIVVTAPDGATSVEIGSLRFADVESGPAQPSAHDVDPRTLAHVIDWQPWDAAAQSQQRQPDGSRSLAVLGEGDAAGVLRDRLAGCGYFEAGLSEARYVLYVAESVAADSDIEAAVALSADVIGLVRQLAERDSRRPATLWILTRGVHEGLSAAALRQSCLWGLAGVIRAEHPDLWGGLVDLPAGDDPGKGASELSPVLPTPAKSVLLLRDGQLLAPALSPVPGRPVREPLRCRPDAAYLITGGMGALGLLMAGWLADLGARRIILASRSALPPRRDWDSETIDAQARHRIAAIRALEMRGVSVDVAPLDVGSPDAVAALLARRDGEGAPPIRGVIHAAGVTDSQLLTDMSPSRLRATMWPKVAGAQALHEAFAVSDLDFLYLTASAGTIFGIPGQGAYAAANAYLDCLARARHRQGDHTVSLDWVAWRGLGFASDAQIVEQELHRLGSRPVVPEEAFAAWEYLEGYDVAQAVMAPMPPADAESAEPGDVAMACVRNWSELPAEMVLSELEAGLRTILARELRMPEADLELDRPFAEMGLNSVMAMSIRRDAEQLVGIELSATMLWNHPTIGSLAGYLAAKLLPVDESESGVPGVPDTTTSVLDSLFDTIESTPASS